MNEKKLRIMGKPVNDMYGSYVGRAVGTATNIDGTVEKVGVDCGLDGLKEVPIKHLVVQDESIVYVPQWRLDSQIVLREKSLLVRRLRALNAILSENDQMKEDSKPVRQFYEEKLDSLRESEVTITETLEARLDELAEQAKLAKSLHFDASIQYKNSELLEKDYKAVKTGTSTVLERIEYETEEIKGMQNRLKEQAAAEMQVRYKDIVGAAPNDESFAQEAAPSPEAAEEVTADVTDEPLEIPAQPTAEIPAQITADLPSQAAETPAQITADLPSQAAETPAQITAEIPAQPADLPSQAAETPAQITADLPSQAADIPPPAPSAEIAAETPAQPTANIPLRAAEILPPAPPAEIAAEMLAQTAANPPFRAAEIPPPAPPADMHRAEAPPVPPMADYPEPPGNDAHRKYNIPEHPPMSKNDWLSRMTSQ